METRFPSGCSSFAGDHFWKILLKIETIFGIKNIPYLIFLICSKSCQSLSFQIFENFNFSWTYSSTNPTGGNQVDGLPPVCNIMESSIQYYLPEHSKALKNRVLTKRHMRSGQPFTRSPIVQKFTRIQTRRRNS